MSILSLDDLKEGYIYAFEHVSMKYKLHTIRIFKHGETKAFKVCVWDDTGGVARYSGDFYIYSCSMSDKIYDCLESSFTDSNTGYIRSAVWDEMTFYEQCIRISSRLKYSDNDLSGYNIDADSDLSVMFPFIESRIKAGTGKKRKLKL